MKLTKKTKVLHYIALHPCVSAADISEGMDMPSNTVRTYLSDLGKEGLIESVGSRKWILAKHISVSSLNIPPEPERIKKPWELLNDAIRSFYGISHVS